MNSGHIPPQISQQILEELPPASPAQTQSRDHCLSPQGYTRLGTSFPNPKSQAQVSGKAISQHGHSSAQISSPFPALTQEEAPENPEGTHSPQTPAACREQHPPNTAPLLKICPCSSAPSTPLTSSLCCVHLEGAGNLGELGAADVGGSAGALPTPDELNSSLAWPVWVAALGTGFLHKISSLVDMALFSNHNLPP